jgi:hypothetical protein
MLLVVGIFALLAIVVLGLMARRYGTILQRRAEYARVETEQTLRRVDGFIRVRQALRTPRGSFQEALDEAGMARAEYVRLDQQYREWKTERPGLGAKITAAFELRRDELAATEPEASTEDGSRP